MLAGSPEATAELLKLLNLLKILTTQKIIHSQIAVSFSPSHLYPLHTVVLTFTEQQAELSCVFCSIQSEVLNSICPFYSTAWLLSRQTNFTTSLVKVASLGLLVVFHVVGEFT